MHDASAHLRQTHPDFLRLGEATGVGVDGAAQLLAQPMEQLPPLPRPPPLVAGQRRQLLCQRGGGGALLRAGAPALRGLEAAQALDERRRGRARGRLAQVAVKAAPPPKKKKKIKSSLPYRSFAVK